MAEDKKDKNATNAGNSLIKNLSNFYKRTFFTPPDADSELENISNKINNSMGRIVNDINYSTGLSSLSTLYAKSLE